MTAESQLSYQGKKFRWLNENQQLVEAIIGPYLISGTTSDLFEVILTNKPPQSKQFVLKIPRKSEVSVEFMDEYAVMDQLASALRKKDDQNSSIPQAYSVNIENQSALIIEHLDPAWRWMNMSEDSKFRETSLIKSTLQALGVFSTAHEIEIANRDVKEDNFYWDANKQHLVVLDWNRCLQDNPRNEKTHELFQSVVRETFRTLAVLFYKLWTQTRPPSPLPPIDSRSVEGWTKCPRSIRRILVESHSSTGINADTISNRLRWLQDLKYYESRDWEGFLKRVESILDDQTGEAIENREQILDACEFFDNANNAPDPLTGELAKIKLRIEEKQHDLLLTMQSIEQDTRKKLEGGKIIEARDFCERKLKEIDIAAKEKWNLAQWYLTADFLINLSKKNSSFLTSDDYHSFISLVADKNLKALDRNVELKKHALELHQIIASIESLIKEANETVRTVPPMLRLEMCRALDKKKLNIIQNLPQVASYYLEMRLPYWSPVSLEEEASTIERMGKLAENRIELKEALRQILVASRDSYPAGDISRFFSESGVELDEELSAVYTSHKEATVGEWARAYREISSSPKSDLVDAMVESVERGATLWCKRSQNRMLYAHDIRQLQDLNYLLDLKEFQDLQKRLIISERIGENPHDLSVLKECLENQLQPFSDGPGKPVLLEYLIEMEKFRQLQGQIETLQQQLDESKVGTQEPVEELRSRVEVIASRSEVLRTLRDKFSDSASLRSELQAKIEEAQELQKNVGKEIERAHKSLGVLENQISSGKLAIEQSKDYVLFEQQAANFVLISAQEHIWRNEFEEADKVLDGFLKQKDLSNSQNMNFVNSMIIRWKQDLSDIRDNKDLLKSYEDWITAIKNNESSTSNSLVLQLGPDQYGHPLYEYLCNRSHARWNADLEIPGDELQRLFNKGEFDQLEKLLNVSASNDVGRGVINEWNYRLQQAGFLAKYLGIRNRDKHVEALLRKLLPREVWIAAEKNYESSRNQGHSERIWDRIISRLGLGGSK